MFLFISKCQIKTLRDKILKYFYNCLSKKIILDILCESSPIHRYNKSLISHTRAHTHTQHEDKNSAEGIIAPAGAKSHRSHNQNVVIK